MICNLGDPRSRRRASTLEDDFRSVHGDRYDYSDTEYNGAHEPMLIRCRVHGVFSMLYPSHLKGSGCPECAGVVRHNNQSFIAKSEEKHGCRYDYSNVNYKNNKSYVDIGCPVHGLFSIRAGNHMRGHGCPQCVSDGTITNTEEFVTKAADVHNNFFDYSDTVYVNTRDPVTVRCPVHGLFTVSPYWHLHGGGCHRCLGRHTNKYSPETYLARLLELHGDEPCDFSGVRYIDKHTKVDLSCHIHGPFSRLPLPLVSGKRKGYSCCPACNHSGFSVNKPAYLYYLKVAGGCAYKIGITNRRVVDRFCKKDRELIEVLWSRLYETGTEALRRERNILSKYRAELYRGEPLLTSGNSELFSVDITDGDYDILDQSYFFDHMMRRSSRSVD